MKGYAILIIEAGIIIILMAVIVFRSIRYKKAIHGKNCRIVRLIREQDSLKCELEQSRIEKETVERLLKSKLEISAATDKRKIIN
jgi:hypothetical protein